MVNDTNRDAVYVEPLNSLSLSEGMKGAGLPGSDVFIPAYGEHKRTVKKSKA